MSGSLFSLCLLSFSFPFFFFSSSSLFFGSGFIVWRRRSCLFFFLSAVWCFLFFFFFFLLVLLSFLLLLLFISVEAGPVTRVYTLAMFPFSSRLSCLYIHGRPECTCADSIQVFDDNVT